MKIQTSILAGLAAIVSASLLITSPSLAEDSQHRRELDRRSRAVGLSTTAVDLLVRAEGPGAASTAERMIRRFSRPSAGLSTAGEASTVKHEDHLRVEGAAGWTLVVFGDGTQVKYRNRAFYEAHRAAIPRAEQPSLAALEERGRAFLQEHLASEIQLGDSESLEVLRSAYEVQGERGVAKGAEAVESMISSVVVFTRVVNGIDVVGPGAKVSVLFTSDGQVWGFDYDWAAYRPAHKSQAVLDIKQIEERARALAPSPATSPSTVRLKRWECGYFDVGARKRDPEALVQAACIAHKEVDTVGDEARHRANPTDGLMSSATMEVIPAGAAPEDDARWPEARRLRGEAPRPAMRARGTLTPTTAEGPPREGSSDADAEVATDTGPQACSMSPLGSEGSAAAGWALALGLSATAARRRRRQGR